MNSQKKTASSLLTREKSTSHLNKKKKKFPVKMNEETALQSQIRKNGKREIRDFSLSRCIREKESFFFIDLENKKRNMKQFLFN